MPGSTISPSRGLWIWPQYGTPVPMYAKLPVKLRPEGFGDRCSDTTGQRAVGYSYNINKIIMLGTPEHKEKSTM
jgi:hypothetical protein